MAQEFVGHELTRRRFGWQHLLLDDDCALRQQVMCDMDPSLPPNGKGPVPSLPDENVPLFARQQRRPGQAQVHGNGWTRPQGEPLTSQP